MKLMKGAALVTAMGMLAACGSDSDSKGTELTTYTFPSKLVEGESSVSYTGQTARHLLINEISTFIKSDAFQNSADSATALANLNLIYATGVNPDAVSNLYDIDVYGGTGTTSTPVSISAPEGTDLTQENFRDVGDVAGSKNLKGKLAGQDNDLSQAFIGWDITLSGEQTDDDRPHLLLQEWFQILADNAGDGNADTTYVDTSIGVDYQQLVQKFLLGAVTYSQAADDYLKASKGLAKNNIDEGGNYTSLEHQWDEGFGYFGAARDYLAYSDDVNKSNPANDTNGDGEIDLLGGEYSFGHAINANKRDSGSNGVTDFSAQAMEAFIAGRQLIQKNIGSNPVEGQGYQAELVDHAKTALGAWEKAIAATVAHYVNDTIADLDNVGTDAQNLKDLAKHWSELKGFALSLQFSGVSIISRDDLIAIHNKIGEAPELEIADIPTYVEGLKDILDILQDAYDFDADVVANW
ncbi:MAG: DUF4856 domain-containing protein [Bermanella sp.]